MPEQNVQKRWREAESYAGQGQLNAALNAYVDVLTLDPTHTMALLRASRVALSLGQYRRGHEFVMRALACKPGSEETILTLARALRTFNEPTALLECVENSRWRERRSAAWLTELAMLVSTIGANDLSLELLDLALIRDPRNASTRYFRGVVMMFFGRMDEAEQELEAAIKLSPAMAQAHWVLSRLRKQTPDSNHVARMQSLSARVRPGTDTAAYMAFAQHNELHDLQQYEQSWAALSHGCRIKKALTPHDSLDARRMFEGLQSQCDAGFLAEHPGRSIASFTPIFIVGMHRSGSTLLEQLLAGHPDVADGGETYSVTTQMRFACDYRCRGVLDAELVGRVKSADFGLVRERYFAASTWRSKGRAFLTEKLPSNFLNVGFIAKALPEARILHMVRDPLDTCFSNLRTLFSDVNTFSYDQGELVAWFGQYRSLMQHWHRAIPGRIMDVHYDQLVAEPESVMSNVLEFCGLPWHDSASKLASSASGAIATASSPQLRAGIIKGRSAAWTPYEKHLAPLIQGLASLKQ